MIIWTPTSTFPSVPGQYLVRGDHVSNNAFGGPTVWSYVDYQDEAEEPYWARTGTGEGEWASIPTDLTWTPASVEPATDGFYLVRRPKHGVGMRGQFDYECWHWRGEWWSEDGTELPWRHDIAEAEWSPFP